MKKAPLIICLIIATLISLPLKNYAQDEYGQELKLYVGEVKMLAVNSPRRIVVGNPSVADVTEVSKSEITISPKRPGTTSLIFWDTFGEQSYRIKVIAEDMTEIKHRVDNLLSKLNLTDVYTQIAEEEGKVLLLGRVKNLLDRETISTALGALKDKTTDLIAVKEEEAAVNIDVQVLELNKDATNTLGFSWPGSITLTDSSGPTTSAATGLKNVFRVSDFTRTAFNVTLDVLIQEGKARLLSRPQLACQSGKEAELLVGGEKPIFTTNVVSGGGSGTEVEYKEFGIKLRIKPTVTEDRRIKLALNVEVSEVGTAEFIGLTAQRTAQAYPLTKRNASTELFLEDGQTMAIGGLMKQKTEEDIRKTPFLGDVPILGLLFRKKTTKFGGGQGERGDIELFITLTPTIVGEAKKVFEEKKQSQAVSEPTVINYTNLPEPLAGYASIVQKRILDNLTYPALAKEAGFQGTVKLSLHLSYKGELLDTALKDSSGYKILDEQAINVAKQVGPYPPFPSSIEQQELWIDIPIAYQLN